MSDAPKNSLPPECWIDRYAFSSFLSLTQETNEKHINLVIQWKPFDSRFKLYYDWNKVLMHSYPPYSFALDSKNKGSLCFHLHAN